MPVQVSQAKAKTDGTKRVCLDESGRSTSHLMWHPSNQSTNRQAGEVTM